MVYARFSYRVVCVNMRGDITCTALGTEKISHGCHVTLMHVASAFLRTKSGIINLDSLTEFY